jgi:hypothetical protein
MLQSDWYRMRWPKPAELVSDQTVKTLFNSSTVHVFATTITGAGTGLRATTSSSTIPHKTKEESQSAEVKAQLAVYSDTFATRHDDKKQGVTVVVMQRINDPDLSAHSATVEVKVRDGQAQRNSLLHAGPVCPNLCPSQITIHISKYRSDYSVQSNKALRNKGLLCSVDTG